MEENYLAKELFEKKGTVEVTNASDWAAIVDKAIDSLPLGSLRKFKDPLGSLEQIVDIYSITDMGHTTEAKPYEFRYCDGLGETTHIMFCCILQLQETPRTLRVKQLVLTRKGKFFISESTWDIRMNNGEHWLSDKRICNLKLVTFASTTSEEVCANFESEICKSHLFPLPVGAAVIRSLSAAVDATRGELWRQYRSLEDVEWLMDDVVRRVGAVTRERWRGMPLL